MNKTAGQVMKEAAFIAGYDFAKNAFGLSKNASALGVLGLLGVGALGASKIAFPLASRAKNFMEDMKGLQLARAWSGGKSLNVPKSLDALQELRMTASGLGIDPHKMTTVTDLSSEINKYLQNMPTGPGAFAGAMQYAKAHPIATAAGIGAGSYAAGSAGRRGFFG